MVGMLWEIINQKEVIDDLTRIQSLRNLWRVIKPKIYMTNKPQNPIKQITEKKWQNRYLAFNKMAKIGNEGIFWLTCWQA